MRLLAALMTFAWSLILAGTVLILVASQPDAMIAYLEDLERVMGR